MKKLTPSRISLAVQGDRIALLVPRDQTPMFTCEQARAFAAALVNLAEQLEAAPAIPTKKPDPDWTGKLVAIERDGLKSWRERGCTCKVAGSGNCLQCGGTGFGP